MESSTPSQGTRHTSQVARGVWFVDPKNETPESQATMQPPRWQEHTPASGLERADFPLEKEASQGSGYSWLRRSMSSMSSAEMGLAAQLQEEQREAIDFDAGDYRVKLRGPHGDIPVDIWDLSKYRWWSFDHYQALRREYNRSKGGDFMQLEGEKLYIMPHPGVDYIYNDCPYMSHAGKMELVSMSAHCILPDGSRLPADLDKNLRATFFSDAGYSIKCNWFDDGKGNGTPGGVLRGTCC